MNFKLPTPVRARAMNTAALHPSGSQLGDDWEKRCAVSTASFKPGESKVCDPYHRAESLAIWNREMKRVVEPGKFRSWSERHRRYPA